MLARLRLLMLVVGDVEAVVVVCADVLGLRVSVITLVVSLARADLFEHFNEVWCKGGGRPEHSTP